MSDLITYETRGIDRAQKMLGDLPGNVQTALVRSVNRGAERGRTEGARLIVGQLNFPGSYLAPSQGRLVAYSTQDNANPQARVVGRNRPTSLARFVTSGSLGKKGGVSVMVKRGHTRVLPNAFLIRLRAGATMDEGTFNLGLAIRLKPGETIKNKREAIQMRNGLWLMYGPSVGQAFGQLIKKNDFAEDVSKMVEVEFDRAMEYLSR